MYLYVTINYTGIYSKHDTLAYGYIKLLYLIEPKNVQRPVLLVDANKVLPVIERHFKLGNEFARNECVLRTVASVLVPLIV